MFRLFFFGGLKRLTNYPEFATAPIEALKKKKRQIENKIKKMEALEKTRQRKIETRRKILIGSYYLKQAMENDNWQELAKVMRDYLSRESDRALFE